MILTESIRYIINESGDKISSTAIAYWLYKQHGEINEDKLQNLIDSKVYFIEEELEIRNMLEDAPANNTSGVEVSNPTAIPKKRKIKDLIIRRLGK